MRSQYEDNIRVKSQRLSDLRNKAAEIERKLSDARLSLQRELAQSALNHQEAAGWGQDAPDFPLAGEDDDDPGLMPAGCPPEAFPGAAYLAEERTEVLVSRGRPSAPSRRLGRWRKVALAAVGTAGIVTVIVVVTALRGDGAAWPASVTRVQAEVSQACQNPDVKSEPGQVNFACAKETRQILWIFALLTSGNNQHFRDPKTGRVGLEPITPAQGGAIAWSLNLHHPYDPASPIDSIQVAARAINNIIGGATATGADGKPVVQAGLESTPSNCIRYTGSAAVSRPRGFPARCAEPVTSPAGQAALVADVYLKWVSGAAASDAQDAAVLFANAHDPANPQVQAILRHLPRRSG